MIALHVTAAKNLHVDDVIMVHEAGQVLAWQIVQVFSTGHARVQVIVQRAEGEPQTLWLDAEQLVVAAA